MGNKVTKRKVQTKMKARPTSPEHSSIQELENVRRSLEPNIGEELQDCTALFDFPGYNECDLAFKRGDMFDHVRTLKDRGDWLLATHSETRERGFVPRDYVCQDSVPEFYKDFSKRKREELLLSDDVREGTYIIKRDESRDSFILDVCFEDTSSTPSLQKTRRTYRIRTAKDKRLYITPRKQFTTVTQLLQYYRENSDDMCCCLRECLPPPKYTVAARDMDIKESSFPMDNRLGRGRFGDVFAGTLKNSIPVAVKMVDFTRLDVQPKTLAEEIKKVAACFRHHRFVQMLGVNITREVLFIISELVPLGTLREYLRQDQGETIQFPQCVDIAHQVCEGMAYMESQGNMFRCLLMCQYVLVGENLQIKIQTTHLATELYSVDSGPDHLRWKAPECMDYDEFTSQSDVWSFGLLMYEIITFGRLNFQEIEHRQFIGTIRSGYKMPKPKSPIVYDEKFWYDVMLSCLKLIPESRATFGNLQDKFENYQSKFQETPGENPADNGDSSRWFHENPAYSEKAEATQS